MSDPKLVSAVNGGYFSVTFPNGLDGVPKIKMHGLEIDMDGELVVYGVITACANYLKNHVDELKVMSQFKYKIEDIAGKFEHPSGKEGTYILGDPFNHIS